jgi:hypothetical protein
MTSRGSTLKRRKRAGARSARRGSIPLDQDLRIPAQAVLTITRHLKGKIIDDPDSSERRRLQRLLERAYRKVRAHREALVDVALAAPQLAGPQLYAQIQIFLLVEDEFTTHARERSN